MERTFELCPAAHCGHGAASCPSGCVLSGVGLVALDANSTPKDVKQFQENCPKEREGEILVFKNAA